MRKRTEHQLMWALLCIVFTFELQGQLPNAWQINDNSMSGGSLLNYITNMTSAQKTSATHSGWRYAVTTRLVTDYGDVGSMYFIFGDGTRRYGVLWDLNGAGQLTASLLGGSTVTLVADETAATNYHVHQLSFDPTSGTVTYELDGQPAATWTGHVSTAQADTVLWGSAASAGRSQMNFHRVEFEIIGQGVIASYSAGLAGAPAAAPDPRTQGWTRSAGATAIPEGPVSPDQLTVPLRAVTRAASDVSNFAATLKGWIGHNGPPTDYYFEYGTTSGYGSVTVTNTSTTDAISEQVSLPLTGLEPGGLYHYRMVAMNDNGMAMGDDATFATYSFSNVTIASLPGVDEGSVSWVDYDNDGLLDFLLTGHYLDDIHRTVSQLWRNTGNGFADVTASVAPGLPQARDSDVAWGDYDNDGRLDFLLTGSTNGVGQLLSNVTQLWRNTPGGFVNVTDTSFPPNSLSRVSAGTVDWGDYDNDGLLDFMITGVTSSPDRITELWRNTGHGFINVTDSLFPPDSLPGVGLSSVSWGDYDNDGRLDFLIMGTYFLDDVVPQYVTQIWRNTGDGFMNVTDTAAPGLPRAFFGCIQWVDFNQDGLLDFCLTGNEMGHDGGEISQLWQSTGNGFINVTDSVAPGLPALTFGSDTSVAWGDYNNDGLMDFLLTGASFDGEQRRTTQLWRNDGGTIGCSIPDAAPRTTDDWLRISEFKTTLIHRDTGWELTRTFLRLRTTTEPTATQEARGGGFQLRLHEPYQPQRGQGKNHRVKVGGLSVVALATAQGPGTGEGHIRQFWSAV